MKLMVMPVGRSLVFSGSQEKNISYPTDHRQKIFRTLPQMAWGGKFFSSDIMWWLGDWTRLILHQLPLPRKSLKRGKDILVSTSWWEVANHIRYGIRFTVRILGEITHYLSLSLSLSPLNVPKTGFPWSIPPDLARLTPSDRYPELDNNNFSPCSGPFDPNSPNSQTSSPEGVVLCVRRLDHPLH